MESAEELLKKVTAERDAWKDLAFNAAISAAVMRYGPLACVGGVVPIGGYLFRIERNIDGSLYAELC